jgi:hypothetical protein
MPRCRGRMLLLVLCWLGAARDGTAAVDDDAADLFFEKEVRPVLTERCLSCHGEAKVQGGLRLTSRAALLHGGDRGAASVAGDAEESLLVQAIRYQDEPRMPPDRKLDDREVATLVRWVEMGLPWPEATAVGKAPAKPSAGVGDEARRFWAFQPLREPRLLPIVDTSWPRSEIDRYVLSALEANGLTPGPPADKRTLLRCAAFDSLQRARLLPDRRLR